MDDCVFIQNRKYNGFNHYCTAYCITFTCYVPTDDLDNKWYI